MIRCPGCQATDPEVTETRIETMRARYAITFYVNPMADHGVTPEFDSGGPVETECLDSDRDNAEWRCESCYYETDDADDFIALCNLCDGPLDEADEDNETCSACREREDS